MHAVASYAALLLVATPRLAVRALLHCFEALYDLLRNGRGPRAGGGYVVK